MASRYFRTEIVTRIFATALLLALGMHAQNSAFASEWVTAGGNIHNGTTPVCALVLINGQTQFSCDGTGRYDMQVPVDDDGMITVMAFADGHTPFSRLLTPEQAAELQIQMSELLSGPTLQVEASYTPADEDGRYIVSGTVYSGTIPVCALALANGQSMFSCNENLGQFSLDVPLDLDGNIALMIFADGFLPYKLITNVVLDSDGDGIQDYLDFDDDNDGIFDTEDACPMEPDPDCKQITDTVTVNGTVWAQLNLFSGLSWRQIKAHCPGRECSGALNGYDVSGWTWASIDDVNTMFNYFIGADVMGPGPDNYEDHAEYGAPGDFSSRFFSAGWKPTIIDLGYTISGLTNGIAETPDTVASAYIQQGVPSYPSYSSRAGTGYTTDPEVPIGGAWLFRSPVPDDAPQP